MKKPKVSIECHTKSEEEGQLKKCPRKRGCGRGEGGCAKSKKAGRGGVSVRRANRGEWETEKGAPFSRDFSRLLAEGENGVGEAFLFAGGREEGAKRKALLLG